MIRILASVAAALIGVAMGRAAVAELFDRDRSSHPAQELAAEQVGGGTGSVPAGFRNLGKPDRGFSIDLPETMDDLAMTAETLDESVELLESLNPTLANVMKGNDALLDQVRRSHRPGPPGTTQVIQRVKAGRGVAIAGARWGSTNGPTSGSGSPFT